MTLNFVLNSMMQNKKRGRTLITILRAVIYFVFITLSSYCIMLPKFKSEQNNLSFFISQYISNTFGINLVLKSVLEKLGYFFVEGTPWVNQCKYLSKELKITLYKPKVHYEQSGKAIRFEKADVVCLLPLRLLTYELQQNEMKEKQNKDCICERREYS